MKNMKLKSKITFALAMGAVLFFGACSADLTDNGITPKSLDATFTVTPVSSSPNKFTLTSSNDNYIFSQWDLDDGAGFNRGDNSVEIFLPDAGTYNVKHQVVGAGGVTKDETKTITVATSDPAAGNLVKGGKFANNDDISKWTVDNLSGGICTFANGWLTFTNNAGSWGQAAIQQPITVVAGKKYKIDMVFKTDGVTQGWFKVYACTTKPTAGTEYTGDILVAEVAIWDYSGAKSGKFSSILNPDSGTKTGNVVTFTQGGTIYLSIQCGANDLRGGVSISNVEFRGVSE